MIRKLSALFCILLFCVGSCFGKSESLKSYLDAEQILHGWEKSYAGIKTLRVSYYRQVIDYHPPANNPDESAPVKHMHMERIDELGPRFHIRYSSAAEGFNRPKKVIEYAFDGNISQEYLGADRHGSIMAGLRGKFGENYNRIRHYMFINRIPRPDLKEEYPDGVPEFSLTLRNGIKRGACTIRPNLESAAGELCHIIELTSSVIYEEKEIKAKNLYWLAHNKGMCLIKYQVYWDDRLEYEMEVEKIAEAKSDGISVWYPEKSYETALAEELGTIKYELTITEFVPNIEVNENMFKVVFPKGTHVYDRVRGMSYRADGSSGPKIPASLIGKSMPDFNDVGIKLQAEQIKDKNVLVCFLYINQRASRNCILQLSKRAQELKAEDIIIVAIE